MWQASGRQVAGNHVPVAGRRRADGGQMHLGGGQVRVDVGQTAACTSWRVGGRQIYGWAAPGKFFQ